MASKKQRKGASKTKRASALRKVSPLMELAATWPFVSRKYMFGCHALLAAGRLFFIEIDGSIVLRVGRERLAGALRTKGSGIWNPWNPGEPGDWVSFPPARRTIPRTLADWARAAYELSLEKKGPPKKKNRRKPTSGRRSAGEVR